MPQTFSSGNFSSIAIAKPDMAPGAPTFAGPLVYENGMVKGAAILSPLDVDGTELSGTDNLHVFGSFFNQDGSSALQNVPPTDLTAQGYLKVNIPVTPAQAEAGEAIPFEIPVEAPNTGGNYEVGIFTSDGQP